jgi:hypothetical protein
MLIVRVRADQIDFVIWVKNNLFTKIFQSRKFRNSCYTILINNYQQTLDIIYIALKFQQLNIIFQANMANKTRPVLSLQIPK